VDRQNRWIYEANKDRPLAAVLAESRVLPAAGGAAKPPARAGATRVRSDLLAAWMAAWSTSMASIGRS